MNRLPYLWGIAAIFLANAAFAQDAEKSSPATCTYNTWEWDTVKRVSVNHRRVTKARVDLTPEEKDPHSACTVCEEDQVTIRVEGTPPVRVCRQYAETLTTALTTIGDAGWPVESLIAYRVGRSRGAVDAQGLRTRFSNHSFGAAIDINSEHNGLYKNCYSFGPHCTLSRGGAWKASHPKSITPESIVYRAMTAAGWKWGGEIQGSQKDFMHFSLTGY